MKSSATFIRGVSSFYFLPHPVVHHKDLDFASVNNIFLKKVHHIVWPEIITCGRKLSGEEFQFTRPHSVTKFFLQEQLVIKENVLLELLKDNLQNVGQLEGFTHQSTLLFIKSDVDMVLLQKHVKKF